MEPAVHVQPDEVTTTHGVEVAPIKQAKWKPQPAGFDEIEKSVIEQAVQQGSYPSIGHSPHRLEHHVVLGPSHLCLWHQLMQGSIRQHMSARLHAVDPESIKKLPLVSRRKFAQHISAGRINIGFVEGDPEAAKVADRFRHLPRETFEKLGCISPEKCSSFLEPSRVGEVMQTNDRLNPPRVQSLQHLPVTSQRRRVKMAFFRLDAAPLQRESQCLQSQVAGDVKVALGILPPVAGLADPAA